MQQFTVVIRKTSFGSRSAELPQDLHIVPLNWSANDRGGCSEAELTASGSPESLANLMGWLGDRVEIYNAQQDCVWWGVLWDLDITLGNIQVTLTMDTVYNRIAVIYPFRLPDGSEESRTTDWAEEPISMAHYGPRELLYSMSSTFSQSAAEVRDQLLARYASPSPVITSRTGKKFEARIGCAGLWKKADNVYFKNLDGLVEHTDANATQVIGRYVRSNQVSFGDETDANGPDDIQDLGGSFHGLIVGDQFTISGAANVENNGTFTVGARDSDQEIETEQENFVDEAAGNMIQISYGDQVSVDNIAQAFRLPTVPGYPTNPWMVTHVAIRCRKLNDPDDEFRIGLYPDNDGVPGTVITAIQVPASALFTELTWTEFTLTTPMQLDADTTYWLQVRRTGAATLEHGYEVSVDEDLGYTDGVMLVWNGSSWLARGDNADMSFRLIGEIKSTAQLDKALAFVPEFIGNLIQVDSGIKIRQYSDEERTAGDEINEMLDAGTSEGYRLLAWVTFDSNIIVNIPEPSSNENLVLDDSGKLRYPTGGLYAPGRLIFGQYIDIDNVAVLDSVGIRANRGPSIYVQASQYDALTDTIQITSEGAVSPWSILTIRKG